MDANTTNVLVEAAVFDAISVRRTAKALGISSEAGSRFEKGVDPAVTRIASLRATSLICQLAGGEAGELTSAGDDKASVRSIAVRMEDINGLLGTNITEEQAIGILNNLGLQVETQATAYTSAQPPQGPGIVAGYCRRSRPPVWLRQNTCLFAPRGIDPGGAQ